MTTVEIKLRRQVQAIVDLWCLPEVVKSSAAAGKDVDPAAEKFWEAHYRRKFYRALKDDGRTWEEDGLNLLAASRLLGALAAQLASEAGHPRVEKPDAEEASRRFDCRRALGKAIGEKAIWCKKQEAAASTESTSDRLPPDWKDGESAPSGVLS